ncbi:putative calcium-binding protein CML30 [Hibiscus syriacus]|uniref:Calcium-binding protein CML30 n=1 Tax=Hibiscus syriacus TaxID=106335 RepID=A0A6A2WJH2_HIBSY|nr:probable calcium-binding protein CML46 [Hibiscus syriacus]KAE8659503.1 putative calcium-binding protein CML30 [Hibiscus syriacus]
MESSFAESPNSNHFPFLDLTLLFHAFTCFNSFLSRNCWFSPKSHHENGGSTSLDRGRNLGFDYSIEEKEDGVRVDRKDVEKLMGNLGIFCSQESEELNESFGFNEVSRVFEEEEPSLDELKEAFDVFDVNKDGFIDAKELQRVLCVLGLKEGLGIGNCKKMIQRFDEDGDGRIGFKEFVKFMEISFC